MTHSYSRGVFYMCWSVSFHREMRRATPDPKVMSHFGRLIHRFWALWLLKPFWASKVDFPTKSAFSAIGRELSATDDTFILSWCRLHVLKCKFSSRNEAPDPGRKSYEPIWRAYTSLWRPLASEANFSFKSGFSHKKWILSYGCKNIGYDWHVHTSGVCFTCIEL